jgi:hypothetical protein
VRAATTVAALGRHTFIAVLQAVVIFAIVITLAVGAALATGIVPSADKALAARNNGSGPTLTVSVGAQARLAGGGGSLTVSGSKFIPSSGGQQVFLWIGYPNDWCSADYTACHGFYADPWVNDDGTFSVTYDNVLMQAGTGVVSAHQWNDKSHKWVKVASETYTTN